MVADVTAPLPHHPLRVHQAQVAELVDAIATGELTGVRDILAAVTPGGGKSLVLVIAAARLVAAGTIERVVWSCRATACASRRTAR